MDIYADIIRNLPVADRLVLVERIWSDIVAEEHQIPISDAVLAEAARRRDELVANPHLGVSHDEMWKRIRELGNGEEAYLSPPVF